MTSTPALFTPLQVGDIKLQHRIALAPLTRFRATAEHVPTAIQAEYYSQRAAAPGTLLITEATFISPQASGYRNAPGAWSEEQAQGWKKIVEAVDAKGSYLFLQMWALGRAADETVIKEEGYDVVSASDVPIKGQATPRPLTVEEIQEYVGWYAKAAKNFVEAAGGAGVEIHGANGYLLDQFIQTNSNKRTDQYGGSIENRIRFPLEVLKAVTDAVGQKKVGIRMSPFSAFNDMKMDNAEIHETFTAYVKAIKEQFPDLAYIHVVEGRVAGNMDQKAKDDESLDFLHKIWSPKVFLDAGGHTAEEAYEAAEHRSNTVLVFGRHFIANPDLVSRIQNKQPLNKYNRDTFYSTPGTSDPTGYTDYPVWTEGAKA